jgi:tRNA A-37 threonylcarbamoyl transferase component Bud32
MRTTRFPDSPSFEDPRSDRPVIQQFQNEGTKSRTYFLGFDRRGWLWRGTPDGVYVADLEQARQGQWLQINRVDGLPAVDTNQNSFFEDSDGSIWFGAENSVIHMFPPDDLLHPTYAPAVFVSAFTVNGGQAEMADSVHEIKSGTDLVAHIGSLQFDRRNALRMRYRLLPEQSSWITQRELDIHLGKLHSGAHRLEVQAQLGSGPWSEMTPKSFSILRPIWLTWPAILGFALAGSLGAAGAYTWRKKHAERAAKNLPPLGEWRLAALSPEIGQLAGTVLDSRFEVGSVLARGGFATVAKGKDLQHAGRPCAIKIFRQELMDKDWMLRRFQQEVLALEKICHPNVVRIFGHGTTPAGSPYLVMDFVEGQTLREKLEKGGLSPDETASYLRQTGNALEEIHAAGICHRDLKPENLMIRNGSPAGQDLVLIDFSIAIVQDPDETLHGLSRAAGTIYYMAPEQSIGFADSSTDIYSLAKIVIEMLTGQRLSTLLPDASMDLPERVRELLAKLNVGLSTSSIDLISSALEFDPSRRPKSASAFANQIAKDLSCVANNV